LSHRPDGRNSQFAPIVIALLLLAISVIAVMAGAVFQRVTGIGFASAAGPALVLLLGPATGVQMLNVLAAGCSLLVLISMWRLVEWRRTILLAVSASATTPLGALLAAHLPGLVLEMAVGIVMLAALSAVAVIARLHWMRRPVGLLVAGALGGITNASVGQAGPMMAAYAAASRWEITRYVASMQACWLVANVVAIAVKGLPSVDPLVAVVLATSLVAGYVASRLVARGISERTAARLLYIMALVGSVVVLANGIAELTLG
jgi:uncharacterized membrane protein YfcA